MTDLLGMTGRGQRAATFRFELLDQHNSLLGGDLAVDMDSPPVIENNINRAVKRQMSGLRLPPSTAREVDTLRHRIRPWMVMEDRTEWPLGVFLFADASRQYRLYGSAMYAAPTEMFTLEGSCLDQTITVDQGSGGINFYRAGHSVYAAIVQQLEAAGITEYDLDMTEAVIGQPIVWKPNTKRLTIINELLAMGGYYSLWFNNIGRAQGRQVPSLDAVTPDHVFEIGGNVIADSVVETDDLLDAPNTYVVVNTSFTDYPVWGTWHVPSAAPNSFQNRGFRVVKEIDHKGVESNRAAMFAAKAAGQADYHTYRWADLSTSLDPRHDTFDVSTWRGDKYREQGWRLPCQEGADMAIELRRVWAEDVADFLAEAA